MAVNKTAFKRVADELEGGTPLTLSHIGDIFGQPFWELIVVTLLDSNDAARAIQLATMRIRGIQPPDTFEDEDIEE